MLVSNARPACACSTRFSHCQAGKQWQVVVAVLHRYHSKALLVTFDSETSASSHVDVLTREVQATFKRLDGDIRSMGQRQARDDDEQVLLGQGRAEGHSWPAAA
jgi:hypothetical protein